mgnify:CR=1 FL=1
MVLSRIRGNIRMAARWLVFLGVSDAAFARWAPWFSIAVWLTLASPFALLWAWGGTALANSDFPSMYGFSLLMIGTAVLLAMFAWSHWHFNGYTLSLFPRVLLTLAGALLVAFQILSAFITQTRTFTSLSVIFLTINMLPVAYSVSILLNFNAYDYKDYPGVYRTLPALLTSCWPDLASATAAASLAAPYGSALPPALVGGADPVPAAAPALAARRAAAADRRRTARLAKAVGSWLMSLVLLWVYALVVHAALARNATDGSDPAGDADDTEHLATFNAGYVTAAAVMVLDMCVLFSGYAGKITSVPVAVSALAACRVLLVVFGDEYYFVGQAFTYALLAAVFSISLVRTRFPPRTAAETVRAILTSPSLAGAQQAWREARGDRVRRVASHRRATKLGERDRNNSNQLAHPQGSEADAAASGGAGAAGGRVMQQGQQEPGARPTGAGFGSGVSPQDQHDGDSERGRDAEDEDEGRLLGLESLDAIVFAKAFNNNDTNDIDDTAPNNNSSTSAGGVWANAGATGGQGPVVVAMHSTGADRTGGAAAGAGAGHWATPQSHTQAQGPHAQHQQIGGGIDCLSPITSASTDVNSATLGLGRGSRGGSGNSGNGPLPPPPLPLSQSPPKLPPRPRARPAGAPPPLLTSSSYLNLNIGGGAVSASANGSEADASPVSEHELSSPLYNHGASGYGSGYYGINPQSGGGSAPGSPALAPGSQ